MSERYFVWARKSTYVPDSPDDSKWKAGDRVLLMTNQSWVEGGDVEQFQMNSGLGGGDVAGSLRQYAVVEEHLLIKAPSHLSFEEAAAIPTAGGTAMHALSAVDIKPGTTVLTQGTGGVSCFAIQASDDVSRAKQGVLIPTS